MSAIGISAILAPSNEFSVIYRAQDDAIVLCDRVLSNSANTTVAYQKKYPPNNSIFVTNLQGTFLGRGSELLAQVTDSCRLEITLLSRSSPRSYQVIYPPVEINSSFSDSAIDTNTCGSCTQGNRVLELSGTPGTQFAFKFQNFNADFTPYDTIRIIRWVTLPKCPPLIAGTDYGVLGAITRDWKEFVLNCVPPFSSFQLSFLGRNSINNAWELACFTWAREGDFIEITFRGFPSSP